MEGWKVGQLRKERRTEREGRKDSEGGRMRKEARGVCGVQLVLTFPWIRGYRKKDANGTTIK